MIVHYVNLIGGGLRVLVLVKKEISMRLFRLCDEDDKEIGFGIYNPSRGISVVSMPGGFPEMPVSFASTGYGVFYLMDSVLMLAHSFSWCCPHADFWYGHEKMNDYVK